MRIVGGRDEALELRIFQWGNWEEENVDTMGEGFHYKGQFLGDIATISSDDKRYVGEREDLITKGPPRVFYNKDIRVDFI